MNQEPEPRIAKAGIDQAILKVDFGQAGLLLLNRSTTNQARGRRRRLKGMIATEGVLPRSGCPHLACCGSPLMSPGIVASKHKIPNRRY